MKIKLCGMFRGCDIEYANEALPDYIGFILGFPKSRRNITQQVAARLKSALDTRIKAVGVFVDSPPEFIQSAVNDAIIDMVQLHGSENAEYIRALRERIGDIPIIKAVKVTAASDISYADTLGADYLLLDNGTGTGCEFDHSLIQTSAIKTPFFIAGGLTPNTVAQVKRFKPFGVDLSSGIETDGLKDRNKMLLAVKAAREK